MNNINYFKWHILHKTTALTDEESRTVQRALLLYLRARSSFLPQSSSLMAVSCIMSGSCFTISSCLSSSSHTSVRSRQLSDYKIHCSWLQQSKFIIYLLWSEFCETRATFRSASTDLDHASVVACGLTQIPAEGSGCRWGGGHYD